MSPAAGGRGGRRADTVFLAVVCALYLGLSLHQISLPGVYGDEAYYVAPTVSLLTGRPFILAGWYQTVFGYRILLALTDRIGPLQSYLAMPFVLAFGYTPLAIRLPAILCGAGTLVAAYLGARIWCGVWVARFGIALVAVSPAFVFTQRMGHYSYGQMTLFTSLVFLFLARRNVTGARRDLWLAAAAAGLAIDIGPHATMVLGGIVLLSLLWPPMGWPPLRDGAIALGFFLLAGWPIIGITLKTGGALARVGWSGADMAPLTLAGFVDTLSAHAQHFRGMLAGIDGVQVTSVGGSVYDTWAVYAFVGSVMILVLGWLASPDKREFAARPMAPMLITLLGLGLTGFITTGRISYQLIMLWPFAVLTIGAGLAEVFSRSRWIALGLAAALALSQLVTTIEVHERLARVRGRGFTSSQVYRLAGYLKDQPGRRVMAMDWGLTLQVYFLTGGAVLADSALQGWWPQGAMPPGHFVEGVRREIADANTQYVFLGPGQGFDRFPQFSAVVGDAGRAVELDRQFDEADGTVAYRVYRVSRPTSSFATK